MNQTPVHNLKMGNLYQYNGIRHLYKIGEHGGIEIVEGSEGIIPAKEPFVLMDDNTISSYSNIYILKVLSIKGIIAWIDVNNNGIQLREYSEEPWPSL